MLEELSNEINAEDAAIWYVEQGQPRLIVKTITPSIKALITGCSLKLIFGRKDDYLCVGVKIIDIPDAPLIISKVQHKSEEHNALECSLKNGQFDIFLINEMNVLEARGQIEISKKDALDVLNFINEISTAYVGTYKKEMEYVHDCFLVSIDSEAKKMYPNACKISIIEIETEVENWNTNKIYFCGENETYNFSINNEREGETFESEIASALVSVFPYTLYKNPKVKIGNDVRELTDILSYYEFGSFLIETKDVSVINSGYERNKTRRILGIQKQVKTAIKQMEGAVKAFMEGCKIYTRNNEEIEINRTVIPHCIILITEFIHDGDWSEIEEMIFEVNNKTGAFFQILDLREFIKILKASSSDARIIDANLLLRWKEMIKKHTIHIRGEYKV